MMVREDSGMSEREDLGMGSVRDTPIIYPEERGFLFKKACFHIDGHIPRLSQAPVQPWTHTGLDWQKQTAA